MKKKKRKIKKLAVIKCIFVLLMTICIGLLIYSGYHIYQWIQENKKVNEQIEEIEKISEVEEQEDTDQTELVNPAPSKSDPYWDYIKINLIDVDFTELKKTNKDVVGWLKVNGTNINYPFVQGKDNTYYLRHQFNKKYNSAGWVFMDFRNNSKDYDKNTIIYAHGRANKTMFGSLLNVIKKSWYNNPDNYIVKISTETENTLWQVFSTYRIKTTNDYLQIDFSSDESYLKFLNMLQKRSVHNYKVNLTAQDKIISLSTCYNNTDKVVLHAKLIKREAK